jgi:LuxR family transcriptional regulator, maltose regulon positive regulatory protein
MTKRLPLRGAKMTTQRLPTHVIARPRLLSTFASEDWRVATIVAGAGAGKSVLATQLLASSTQCAGALFHADQGDDRPEHFWTYVVAALQRSQPGTFDGSERLLRSRTGRAELFVSQLLYDAERLERQAVLVVEDLHTIRDGSILSTLDEIVDYLPQQLRLVFTSRRDLDLPVARWRARSWLVEIRQEDLAFDHHETRQLLTALGIHGLADAEIESVRTQTDGLVAALQLAAVAAHGDDVHEVVRGFGGKYRIVADFIGSEIIDKQPEDVREFMVRTSIVETLDPELCNALSRHLDSELRLRALEAETHFLSVLKDSRSSYRYHPLLRDVLRSELARWDRQDVDELHLIAAQVLERRGHSLAAARHLMSIDEYDRAFELLFGRIGEVWKHGDLDAATAWLDAVPVELMEQNAHRMLLYGLALCMCWRLDEASPWLARARAALAAQPGASDADAALGDAIALMLFTLDGTDHRAARGDRVLDRASALPDLAFLQARLRSSLARAQLLDDEPVATLDAIWNGRGVGDLGDAVLSLGLAARIALRHGQLVAAADCAGRALVSAETFDAADHLEAVDARLAQLGVAIERDELDSVPPLLEALRDIGERLPAFTYRLLVRLEEVRILRARSGLDDALAALTELRGWFDDLARPMLESRLDALEARLLIDAGELTRADVLLVRLPAGQPTRGLLEVRLLLGRGEATAARAGLDRLHLGNLRDRLDAGLLSARAAVLLGEELDGPMTRIVELAAPERFVRVLREEDEGITRLVRRAAEASAVFGSERLAAALGAPPRRRPASTVLVSLGERERDVLRFLPTRLTNAEIASECFMSVNTVKAHLKKIYSKLAVTTRADAVERARDLGELPSHTHRRAFALEQRELFGARP